MADIIKQLEEGKRIQEEQGIDVNSLRTKLNTEEETEKPEKKKRGRKKKEEILLQDPKQEEQQQDIPQDEIPIPEKKEEPKPRKYSDFDFSNFYEVGQVVFYVRALKKVGIKELLELKVRTIYPEMIIGCEKGKAAYCIGAESKDLIFTKRNDAIDAYNKIDIVPKPVKKEETVEMPLESEEEEKDEQD